MPEVREEKKKWRLLVVDLFRSAPLERCRRLDAGLSRRAAEVLAAEPGRTLLGFAPMADEPDLTPFFRQWRERGGALALPVWLGGERMLLRRVGNLDSDLKVGRGGIMEPVESLPEVSSDDLYAAIIPGRAFSESGVRLGRGSGCYDALFRNGRGAACRRIGVAYDFQVFPGLPEEGCDVAMDMVLTPGRTIAPNDPARGGCDRS